VLLAVHIIKSINNSNWLYRFNYENNVRKIKISLLELCDKLYE